MTLRATLLADGSSDAVLLHVVRWVCMQIATRPVEVVLSDLRGLPNPPRDLQSRISTSVELYPCELLFVHRDAEAQSPELRFAEVERANDSGVSHVCLVPVRMQEAWLLWNEEAIRSAAGRPRGTEDLELPPMARLERLPDPKDVLHRALRVASNLSGRKAKRFRPQRVAHRLAELIDDWSPLRDLSAFRQLEADTQQALNLLGAA